MQIWRRKNYFCPVFDAKCGCTIRRVSSDVENATKYCVDLVKRADRESYLCCLLLPRKIRDQAFAVRAFNCELSIIRDQVKNRQAGLSRLQFWQFVVNSIFDQTSSSAGVSKITHHPVSTALHAAYTNSCLKCYLNELSAKKWPFIFFCCNKSNIMLTIEKLDNKCSELRLQTIDSKTDELLLTEMVESRKQLVSEFDTKLRSMDEFEAQSDKTFGACTRLTLNLLHIFDQNSHDAAIQTCRSLAMINLLRSFFPVMIKKSAILLPESALKQCGTTSRLLLRSKFKNCNELENVAKLLSQYAAERLSVAREIHKSSKVPGPVHSALIFTAIVDHYLALLNHTDYNLYDKRFQAKNTWISWKIWWYNILNKF